MLKLLKLSFPPKLDTHKTAQHPVQKNIVLTLVQTKEQTANAAPPLVVTYSVPCEHTSWRRECRCTWCSVGYIQTVLFGTWWTVFASVSNEHTYRDLQQAVGTLELGQPCHISSLDNLAHGSTSFSLSTLSRLIRRASSNQHYSTQ